MTGQCVVKRLIRVSLEDEVSADKFQLVRSIVGKPGYQVKWVHITKGVDKNNKGNAKICFHKPGAEDIRVDARPSDAINFAKQFRSPIYVSKQIVLTYGIKLTNETTGILRDKNPIYEVYLDSAMDGPDILAEEFDLVSKMNLAVKEERYSDAVGWHFYKTTSNPVSLEHSTNLKQLFSLHKWTRVHRKINDGRNAQVDVQTVGSTVVPAFGLLFLLLIGSLLESLCGSGCFVHFILANIEDLKGSMWKDHLRSIFIVHSITVLPMMLLVT